MAESAREEPMEEPPADAEVAVEEVAGRKAAPPETQKEEPEGRRSTAISGRIIGSGAQRSDSRDRARSRSLSGR